VDWPVVIIALVLLVLFYVWWLARRIGRLNVRTGAALDALQGQLERRAAAAATLTGGGAAGTRQAALLAPNAGRPDTEGRQAAENDLVRALRQLPVQAADDPELRAENRRLGVARQVYNDAVRDTRALRTARVPRMFFLGRGTLPGYFDIDELDLDAIEQDKRGAEAVRAAVTESVAAASAVMLVPRQGPESVSGVGEATTGHS
jgi:hypothetical protein